MRKIILISSLILINAFFIWILPTKADLNPSGLDLQLIPRQGVINPNDSTLIEVWVTPNGNRVTAAELRLTFDPAVIAPISGQPITPGTALSLVLPNCEADTGCPATSSASPNQALIYLGVNCTENGCPIPDSSARFLLATLNLQSVASDSGVTQIAPQDPTKPTLTAALAFDTDATRFATGTSLSVSPCGLAYDYQPNGQVDVVDLMQASSHWNTGPDSQNYDGLYDKNSDGQIDILDLQAAAASWNTTCIN